MPLLQSRRKIPRNIAFADLPYDAVPSRSAAADTRAVRGFAFPTSAAVIVRAFVILAMTRNDGRRRRKEIRWVVDHADRASRMSRSAVPLFSPLLAWRFEPNCDTET